MCERCGLKRPHYGLASEGNRRWCAGCGDAEGAVSFEKEKICEGCGLKQPAYGLASEGKRRWCAGCGKAEGAVSLQKEKMCEECGLKQPEYGLASERKKRWCAGCGQSKGADLLKTQKMYEGCGLKRKNYGLASEGKRRWCAGCGKVEGAVRINAPMTCEGCGLKVPLCGLLSEGKKRWCMDCPAEGAVGTTVAEMQVGSSRASTVPMEALHTAGLKAELSEDGLLAAGLAARLAEHGRDGWADIPVIRMDVCVPGHTEEQNIDADPGRSSPWGRRRGAATMTLSYILSEAKVVQHHVVNCAASCAAASKCDTNSTGCTRRLGAVKHP